MRSRTIAFTASVIVGIAAIAACDPAPPPTVGQQFPTPATTGVPDGWVPTQVIQGDLVITTPQSEIHDVEVMGSIEVRAADVSIHDVRVHGRIWNQFYPPVEGSVLTQFHMIVVHSDVGDGTTNDATADGAIGPGNYAAAGNEVRGSDGFRVSDAQATAGGDNSVSIIGNYFQANSVGGDCGFHIDGVQGYFGGPTVNVRGNTLDTRMQSCVNAAVFFADFSEAADVQGNLLLGPDHILRIQDFEHDPDHGPWVVRGNALVNGGNQPVINTGTECGAATTDWHDNHLVTVSENYQVTSVGREVLCEEG